MKKILSAIIILAVLLSIAVPALAESKVVATGSVNLRTGPGLSYDKVGSVNKGTSMKYLGKTSTDGRGVKWYKVSYKGKSAWISSRYASLNGSSGGSSSSGGASSNVSKPTTSAKNKVVATGQVNLRSGPGLGYGTVGTVAKGSSLKYLGSTSTDGRGVKWYKVSYNGKSVWISSRYASLKGAGSSASSNSKPTTTAKNKVTTTAGVNLRSGPGTGYSKITTVQKGSSLKYLDKTSKDSHGVKWYKVSYNGGSAWVSSKYAKLKTGGSSASATTAPAATATPAPADDYNPFAPDLSNDTTDGVTADTPAAADTAAPSDSAAVTSAPADYVEISGFFQGDLVSAAVMLGISDYQEVQSEVPKQYYNDSLTLAGNDNLEYIRVNGTGYTLYGVCVGMDINSAKALLSAAGLDEVDRGWVTGFEHRAADDAPVNVNGHDSCINVYTDQNGLVTELNWSAYTA